MIVLAIALLVAVNGVYWTNLLTSTPSRPGVFEEHPMVGVALICFAALAGMWIHGRL